MKKIICRIGLSILLASHSIAGIASSIVPLAGGGNVAPSTTLNISLNGLIPTVAYTVVCYINTNFPFQYVLLGSTFADTTSAINSYSLNGIYVNQQDQLIVGTNIVAIQGHFTTPATATINFTNLDQTNSFNINNCFGIPVQSIKG